ncbi:hypothetical protein, partial [Kocuria atrinae]|uniref:hypothetical protein n=1 Tax=Kocuria atrinae TaxID=592377 RepID=UPI001CB9D5B6
MPLGESSSAVVTIAGEAGTGTDMPTPTPPGAPATPRPGRSTTPPRQRRRRRPVEHALEIGLEELEVRVRGEGLI